MDDDDGAREEAKAEARERFGAVKAMLTGAHALVEMSRKDLEKQGPSGFLNDTLFIENRLVELTDEVVGRALRLSLDFFEHRDRMNSAVHEAEVRWSEVTVLVRRAVLITGEGLSSQHSLPVGELQLSTRVLHCLYDAYERVETIGDLCRLRAEDLCGLRNFGLVSLVEIQKALAGRGLSLKPGRLG